MISQNLKQLRKRHHYTQEQVSEKIGVSRQSIAKWECGESIPDINSCIKLAQIYEVSLDNLVYHTEETSGLVIPPKGKHYFGMVSISSDGEIKIPVKAREIFKIEAGDQLLILGDEERGMAIVPKRNLEAFVGMIGVIQKD